jgi:hypothetical protein
LNFAQARYQSPAQGRFTSVDPLGRSASVLNPQSFNRYSYVLNNPTNLTDPTGMMQGVPGWSEVSAGFWGSYYDPNGSHFGGPGAIADDVARHDRWVDIDRNGGKYGDDDYPSYAGDGRVDSAAGETAADEAPQTQVASVNIVGGDPVGGNSVGQATDNPARIDSEPNSACSISVFFQGDSGIEGMTNGVNYFLGNPGLGITVQVSVPSGGISEVGGVQYKRKGWRLQQLINVYGWNARGGARENIDTPTSSDRIASRSIKVNGNSAKWIDHFGPNLYNRAHQRLTGHDGQTNVIIKAMNRGKGCSVEFHAITTMGSDGIFHASWRR